MTKFIKAPNTLGKRPLKTNLQWDGYRTR